MGKDSPKDRANQRRIESASIILDIQTTGQIQPTNNCIICGKWPEKDRLALREMIDTLPLNDEPICDECLRSFWHRVVEQPDSPSKH